MKSFKTGLLLLIVFATYLSCQREIYFDKVSIGVLKKDGSGNCLPIVINGTFKIDSALSARNFVEVQVDVSFHGTFDITSDTVNGYYFHESGFVETGTHTIRVYGNGKPIATGNNSFTVRYGTSTCNLYVPVTGLQPANYTLVGSPDTCSGAFADGNYTIGVALNSSNILTVQVNVTSTGTYSLTGSTANGFSFSGSGIFTTTGLQYVVLTGTGKPIKDEVSNVIVNNIASACHLGIPVLSDTVGKAIFIFDGTPNNCISPLVNGNYYAGIVSGTVNTVVMRVTVSKQGTYGITTNTANGITFSCAGSFATTGSQTVTLTATGTPLRSESTAFIPNTGTQACNFYVDIQPLPPPASYTLSGSPGACSPVTVSGFYIKLKPLDAANTATIQVNVSSPGSYSITTNTNSGMTFSASGVFTTAGLQNVILQGAGIPQATGSTAMTPHFNASSCSFNVVVQ